MKVCDWAEGATCDKDYWDFVRVLECLREAFMGKGIIRGICKGLCEMGRGSHGWRRGQGGRKEGDSSAKCKLDASEYLNKYDILRALNAFPR